MFCGLNCVGLGEHDVHILLAGGVDMRHILFTLLDAQKKVDASETPVTGKVHVSYPIH